LTIETLIPHTFLFDIVILPKPLLTNSLDHKVEVGRGQTAQFKCYFLTVTTERFTKFKWTKNDQPISIGSSDKYHFIQTILPGSEYKMMSKLMIVNVTEEDEGRYTCSCNYNLNIARHIGVTHMIISDSSTTILELTGCSLTYANKFTRDVNFINHSFSLFLKLQVFIKAKILWKLNLSSIKFSKFKSFKRFVHIQ